SRRKISHYFPAMKTKVESLFNEHNRTYTRAFANDSQNVLLDFINTMVTNKSFSTVQFVDQLCRSFNEIFSARKDDPYSSIKFGYIEGNTTVSLNMFFRVFNMFEKTTIYLQRLGQPVRHIFQFEI